MPNFCDLPKRWRRIINPAAEPIHRNECKAQASLSPGVTQWDADFDRWIAAARDQFEQAAEVALVAQSWELVLPEFPCRPEMIELWVPPVRALAAVRYVDVTGTTQTVDDDELLTDLASFPAEIAPRWEMPWPTCRPQPRSVEVQFRTGYAAPVLAVDVSANTLRISPNDLDDGDSVRLGVSGGELPQPLAARTDYFVVNATGSTIQLAETEGGDAINLTDAGSGQILVGEVPDMALQAIRMLVAHYWRNREATTDLSMIPMPLGWDSLVAGCRWR